MKGISDYVKITRTHTRTHDTHTRSGDAESITVLHIPTDGYMADDEVDSYSCRGNQHHGKANPTG